ncbi:MAG: hypothetical protein ACR2LL_03075 [Nitrosopumilus sp.]
MIAEHTIVEQHSNKEKCHILFYTKQSIQSQAPLFRDDIPKIEIKSGGNKLLYCAGGIHKDGSLIKILNSEVILVSDKDRLEKKIDKIFKKYGLEYLRSNKIDTRDKIKHPKNKVSNTNRQGELLSIVTTYALKNKGMLDEDDVIYYTSKLSQKLSKPYPEKRVIQLGKSSYKYSINSKKSDPKIEIKAELKTNWNILKSKKSTETQKNTAKKTINELQELLGSELPTGIKSLQSSVQ